MTEAECREKVRCSLSDKTGVLRFDNFEIVDAAECEETADKIADYLIGRALSEVKADRIREIGRDGHALCANVVAQLVIESQEVFVGGKVLCGSKSRQERTGQRRKEAS